MSRRARAAVLAVGLLLAADLAPAQIISYPILLGPREMFTAPADQDTVFVLSRDQFSRAILAAESLGLADSTITVLETKAALLGKIITEQRGIIDVRSEAYSHYRDLWDETDRDLEEAEVRVDKLERDRWRWSLVSAVVAGVTAFLIGSNLN